MKKGEGAGPLAEGDEVTVVVVSVRGDKVALSQRSKEEIDAVRGRRLRRRRLGAGGGAGSRGWGPAAAAAARAVQHERRPPGGTAHVRRVPEPPADCEVRGPALPSPPPLPPPLCCPQERQLEAEGMTLGEATTGKSVFAMRLAAAGVSADKFAKAAVRA